MTQEEQIEKIKELEQNFLQKIEMIKQEYQHKMRDIVAGAEKSKIESLKKDLGI